jgi:hypothetical protein
LLENIPSISINKVDNIRSDDCDSDESDPLSLPIDSNWSKNTMHGAEALTFLKMLVILFEDSPTSFDKTSLHWTDMKFDRHSFAIAYDIFVFPRPDGPYSKIPFVNKKIKYLLEVRFLFSNIFQNYLKGQVSKP